MKVAKRILLILLFLLILVVTSGVIIAYVYQDKVKAFLVAEITKNINAKTGVSEIDFSVLRKFPMASLEFRNIWCLSNGEHMSLDTLFYADRLFLQFHIMDVFSDHYSITKIDLEEARVNIEVNKYGKDNYHFWKASTPESGAEAGEDFAINLDKTVFKNTKFKYIHAVKHQHCSVRARNLVAKGSLMERSGSLSVSFDMLIQNAGIGDTEYLEYNDLSGNIDLKMDSSLYEMTTASINLDGLKVNADGYLSDVSGAESNPAHPDYSFRFTGSNMDLNKLRAFDPDKNRLKGLTISGKSDLNVVVSSDGSSQEPSVRVDFKTHDASLGMDSLRLEFTHINLDGMYASNHSSSIDKIARKDKQALEVYVFSAQLGFDTFGGSFRLWDFDNPQLDLKLNGEVDVKNLKESNVPGLDSMAVALGDVKFEIASKGPLKAYSGRLQNDLNNIALSGFVDVDGLIMQLDDKALPVEIAEGRLVLSNNDVLVRKLSLEVESSNLIFDGAFHNAIPFLLMEGQDVFVNAHLTSGLIDLNELLKDYSTLSGSDTVYELDFPKQLKFNLSTSIDQLIFRRFDARDIKGVLKLKDRKLIANDVQFRSMNGSIALNGLIDGAGSKLLVSCEADLKDINIQKMFNTFENFGQTYITESQIKGIGTAHVQFASVWNKDLSVIEDKIYAKAAVTIVKGELINNESLMALSDYISVSELQHVRFSKLENQIEIKNRNIHIPKMEVASSALNITASGDHTFDHVIDYKFKIYLPELLSKKSRKAKKENEEFGVIEDDGLGMWLFLSMTGTVDEPIIRYDKKSYVQKIGEDIKKEKQTLKSILNEEFGWFKKDTAINKKDKPVNAKGKKEKFGDAYFIIEWDEDSTKQGLEEDDDDF